MTDSFCVYLFISSINIYGLSRQSGYIWSHESDSSLAYLSYQARFKSILKNLGFIPSFDTKVIKPKFTSYWAVQYKSAHFLSNYFVFDWTFK